MKLSELPTARQHPPTAEKELASLHAFAAESETLLPLVLLNILQQLDFCEPCGWRVAGRITALGIDPRFTRLLNDWHFTLEEEGWLTQKSETWFAADCMPNPGAVEQRLDDGKHRLRQFLCWMDEAGVWVARLFPDSAAVVPVLREPNTAGGQLLPASGEPFDSRTGVLQDIAQRFVNPILSAAESIVADNR